MSGPVSRVRLTGKVTNALMWPVVAVSLTALLQKKVIGQFVSQRLKNKNLHFRDFAKLFEMIDDNRP